MVLKKIIFIFSLVLITSCDEKNITKNSNVLTIKYFDFGDNHYQYDTIIANKITAN